MIVHKGVAGLVRLHVEMSALVLPFRATNARRAAGLLCRSDFRDPAGNRSPSHGASCHLQKRSTTYQFQVLWSRFSLVRAHTYLLVIASALVARQRGAPEAPPVKPHQNPAMPCGLL